MNESPIYNIDRGLAESKLVDAVLALQRHLDGLKKLRDDCEPCEVEQDPEFDRSTLGLVSDGIEPCWKQKVPEFEPRTTEEAYAGPSREWARTERAALVAEHYCAACQRNEVKIRAWYDGRRKTGGKRAAVTRLARRLMAMEAA